MLRRFYHVTATQFSAKKQGIKLCKMINPNSKRIWHPNFPQDNSLPSVKSLTKVKHEPNKRSNRRITVLNKLFMKNITDLMSTGTTSIDVLGRGIEISKVKVAPDLQRVNVFWVCKGNANDAETAELLDGIAGSLRHELSTLRLMGEVPYIVFVKDTAETRLVDLDRCLAIADYGEDFEPTDPGHLLKSEFTLSTSIPPDIKARIHQLDATDPPSEEPLPEMTHNVYGLDHAQILGRLTALRQQTRNAWAGLATGKGAEGGSTKRHTTAALVDVAQQREELAQFLQKRKIEIDKMHKKKREKQDPIVELDNARADCLNEPEYFDDEFDEDDGSFYDYHPKYGFNSQQTDT